MRSKYRAPSPPGSNRCAPSSPPSSPRRAASPGRSCPSSRRGRHRGHSCRLTLHQPPKDRYHMSFHATSTLRSRSLKLARRVPVGAVLPRPRSTRIGISPGSPTCARHSTTSATPSTSRPFSVSPRPVRSRRSSPPTIRARRNGLMPDWFSSTAEPPPPTWPSVPVRTMGHATAVRGLYLRRPRLAAAGHLHRRHAARTRQLVAPTPARVTRRSVDSGACLRSRPSMRGWAIPPAPPRRHVRSGGRTFAAMIVRRSVSSDRKRRTVRSNL